MAIHKIIYKEYLNHDKHSQFIILLMTFGEKHFYIDGEVLFSKCLGKCSPYISIMAAFKNLLTDL